MHHNKTTETPHPSEQQPSISHTNETPSSQNPSPPKRHAVYVRMSPEEHLRLTADAEIFGKSPPDMLREGYFHGAQATPLISKGDIHSVIVALSRIGNNVNQIARQVNTGVRQGFNAEFTAVTEEVMVLNTVLRAICNGLPLPQCGGRDGNR